MKKTILTLALLGATATQLVMAQSRTVSGTVLDVNGEPVIGANIQTADGQAGTVTDYEGNFSISIPDGASQVLNVDYPGMNRQVIDATTASGPVVVNFTSSSTAIDEVIVTGYRTVTKEDYVGAADRLDAKQIEKFPVADITKAIEGAAPGIQVTSGSGAPGQGADVRVRGFGSLSGNNAPLYVVDGAPYAGDITAINPLDIENVTILKDATATSLYGSRGANGVIVITTKKGRYTDGKPTITVDAKAGFIMRGLPDYDIMKSEKEYYETAFQAYVNTLVNVTGYTPEDAALIASGQATDEDGVIYRLGGYNSYDVTDNMVLGLDGKVNPNANLLYHDVWDKELMRTGNRQDYNIGISGGDLRNDYYFSMGYLKENGFIKYSDYDRFSGRINVNSRVTDYLKVGLNLGGSFSESNFLNTGGSSSGNPMYLSRSFAPVYPVYYRDSLGNTQIDPLTGMNKWDWGAAASANPLIASSSIGNRQNTPNNNALGSMHLDVMNYKVLNITAVPYIEVKFLNDFTFNTMLNYNYYDQNDVYAYNSLYGQFASNNGRNTRLNRHIKTYTFRQQLNYNKLFNDVHQFGAFAVHENYSLRGDYLSASANGIPLPGNTNLAGATDPEPPVSYDDFHRLESYLFGANYNFNQEYYLDASMRWDGSSRFSPQARWSKTPFWAIGGAWNMHKAMFFRDLSKTINVFKLKASYGTQGNEALGDYYIWQSLYRLDFPNGNTAGGLVNGLGNVDLTWEKQGQFNVGFEFGVWNSRLTGEINYYNKTKNDLLFELPTAPSLGNTSSNNTKPMNIANMYNRGIEVTLGGDIIRKPDFIWSVSTNLTTLKNEITKMPDELKTSLVGTKQLAEGHSLYDFFIVEHAGVDPNTGAELYYNYDSAGAESKDSVYANVSVSGRKYVGSAIPDLMGSFRNDFQYKGFDLSFLLTYGIGGQFYDGVYASLMQPGTWGTNWHRDILNAWSPTNTGSSIPRVEMDNIDIGGQSTRFLIDASYLNWRNLSIGYTLPTRWTNKAYVSRVRVYGLVDNVLLLSKRKGLNPQASFEGVNDFSYTPARTIMFGINVTL